MPLPLQSVFRRGAVFLWTSYAALDDPTLQGQTKPKYIVMLSASALDDPLFYMLTTSHKPKHVDHPFPNDLFHISAGTYGFLPVDTLIDAGEAGALEVGRDEFTALYDSGEVLYKGGLSSADVTALVAKIVASARVRRRFKQMLTDS